MVLVQDLGEKGLIREVLSSHATTAHADALEDCIVIDPEHLGAAAADAPLIVYSMDHPSLIDRPVPPGFVWRFHGRWLAACACNDVLAMGARPRGLSIDLAIPADTDVAVVTQLYTGVDDVLREYGAVLEGGNTEISAEPATVAMCWGTVSRSGIIRRRGARPGDYIAVTTELGVGWASYLLRKNGQLARLGQDFRDELDGYNLMPLAPHKPIIETAQRYPGAITSGMDLSDGLVEFLYTIAHTPGLGALVDERLVPVSPLLRECAAILGVPAAALAIEYGYDMPRAHGYTVAPQSWRDVADVFSSYGSPLHRVGEVTADAAVTWQATSGERRRLHLLWDDKCRRADAIPDWLSMVERYF